MSDFLFPDNTVLCNFAAEDHLDGLGACRLTELGARQRKDIRHRSDSTALCLAVRWSGFGQAELGQQLLC